MDRTVTGCIRVRMTWLIGLLAIAGCLPYQDRPVSPAKALDEFDSRTLDGQDLHAYPPEGSGRSAVAAGDMEFGGADTGGVLLQS